MNALGKRRGYVLPDPLVVDQLEANEIRASKRLCIGQDPDAYCLPEEAPAAAGDVIVSNGDGTSSWTGVAPLANVVQRSTLVEFASPDELNDNLTKAIRPVPAVFNGRWDIALLPSSLRPEMSFRFDNGAETSNVFGLICEGAPLQNNVYDDFQMGGNNADTTGVTCVGFTFDNLPIIPAERLRVFVEIECNVGAFFNCDVDVFVTPQVTALPEYGALATNDFEVFRAALPAPLFDDMIYRDQARKSQQASQPGDTKISLVRVELAETLVRKLIADNDPEHQVVFQFRTPNPGSVGFGTAVLSWMPVIHRVAVTYERTTGNALGTVLPEDQIDHSNITGVGTTSHADLDTFKNEIESRFVVDPAKTSVLDDQGQERIEANAADLILKNQFGDPNIFMNAGSTTLYAGVGAANRSRVSATPTQTVLESADGQTWLFLEDDATYIEKFGVRRVDVAGASTALRSDGGTTLVVDNGALRVGSGASDYDLPVTRGSDNQLLTTNAVGTVTWQDPAVPKKIEFDSGVDSARVDATAVDELLLSNATVVVDDTAMLQLGSTSSSNGCRCVTIKIPSFEAIPAGHVLKLVNDGGVGKVAPVLTSDDDSVGVIGISANATGAADEDQIVTIGGVFEAVVEAGVAVVPGNPLEKSDTLNSGRVIPVLPSVGHFGIALTGGTGDVGGTVTVKGLFTKNEVF